MRILLVNRFFGGDQVPTGRMLRDVARHLAEKGHDVRVLTSSGSYAETDGEAEGIDAIDITFLPTLSILPKSAEWGLFWLLSCLFVPLMEWDRGVLMTDPPFLVFAAYLSHLVHGDEREVYWWTMDLYPEAMVAKGIIADGGGIDGFLRRVNEASLERISGVVCLGERQRKRLEKYSAWRPDGQFCEVVPPWDYRPIDRVRKEENRFLEKYGLGSSKVALYAGNLGEAHSYEELLGAAIHFEETSEDWRFVFVVRGAQRSALEAESQSLDNVVVLDYQPPELTNDLLWAADVHLITMQPGWEGIVVPSKLYGTFQTSAPVLFVGPPDSDTAMEVRGRDAGRVLPNGVGGSEVAAAIKHLEEKEETPRVVEGKPSRVADFFVR